MPKYLLTVLGTRHSLLFFWMISNNLYMGNTSKKIKISYYNVHLQEFLIQGWKLEKALSRPQWYLVPGCLAIFISHSLPAARGSAHPGMCHRHQTPRTWYSFHLEAVPWILITLTPTLFLSDSQAPAGMSPGQPALPSHLTQKSGLCFHHLLSTFTLPLFLVTTTHYLPCMCACVCPY